MTCHIGLYGRVGTEPREHETRTGNVMATCSIAVDLEDRTRGADEGAEFSWWVSVIAFGRVAEDLIRHSKGDPVSMSGRLQHSTYQGRDGEERESWQVLADSLVSARTVRRGGRRRQWAAGHRAPAPAAPVDADPVVEQGPIDALF